MAVGTDLLPLLPGPRLEAVLVVELHAVGVLALGLARLAPLLGELVQPPLTGLRFAVDPFGVHLVRLLPAFLQRLFVAAAAGKRSQHKLG